MRRPLRPGVGALLLAAAVVVPRAGGAADAHHPLDPELRPGVLVTEDPFASHIPMLDREAPAPSFVRDPTPDGHSAAGAEATPAAPTMDPAATGHAATGHAGMAHGAHGAHGTATTE